jgi:hypothetical protein
MWLELGLQPLPGRVHQRRLHVPDRRVHLRAAVVRPRRRDDAELLDVLIRILDESLI